MIRCISHLTAHRQRLVALQKRFSGWDRNFVDATTSRLVRRIGRIDNNGLYQLQRTSFQDDDEMSVMKDMFP